jgi:hypothetical protein
VASEDDDLPDLLPNPRDEKDKESASQPPQPEAEKEDKILPVPDVENKDEAAAYSMAPVPDEHKELAEALHKRSRRRRRDRSIVKGEDRSSSPFTLRHGWIDFLFETSSLPMTLALTFFCFPLMLPVAIFGAISAHDAEPRKNAFVTIGFHLVLVPLFLLCCIGCMFGSKH